jgi:hypothetical protein
LDTSKSTRKRLRSERTLPIRAMKQSSEGNGFVKRSLN